MQQYTRFADADAKVAHTHEVLDSIDRVLTRLVDAETGQRGYLLTKNRARLQSYEGVASDVHALLSHLEQLVADNPEQHARSRRLAELAEHRLNEMAVELRLSEAGDATGAVTRLSTDAGERIMEDLRRVATEMRVAENSLLVQRADQARLARRAALAFAIVSLLVAIALSVVAVTVQRHFEHRRLAFEQEMSARLAAEHEATAAAAHLQQSEIFNRSILDNSGDCIQVLEPDGRIVLVNRPGLALMEIDDENALRGESWTTLWNSDADSRGGRWRTRSPRAKADSTRSVQPSRARQSGGTSS